MQSLDDLLSHHSLVTFRYYAQHAGLPVTDAKEALREYADSHKGEVHVVHLLGGQRKTESGDGPLEYKLVPEEQLEETKELFEPLTACHPYSIHAKKAESGEKLFLLNHGQDRDLYDELRATSSSNCLLDNRWAAVKCSAATLRPKKAPVAYPVAAAAAAIAPQQRSHAGRRTPGAQGGAARLRLGRHGHRRGPAQSP